ncbi:uncharacterized protein LOC111265246 [Varroa jacobsoni]|uniref:uncharacterized protein LOC111265246 n=1 Tax=Varroa jacobsoni TaxID=62625 RepID=UPI000BF3E655|nr:uncharacterized protein LOC111265246 [Varroa jacobsoni]
MSYHNDVLEMKIDHVESFFSIQGSLGNLTIFGCRNPSTSRDSGYLSNSPSQSQISEVFEYFRCAFRSISIGTRDYNNYDAIVRSNFHLSAVEHHKEIEVP